MDFGALYGVIGIPIAGFFFVRFFLRGLEEWSRKQPDANSYWTWVRIGFPLGLTGLLALVWVVALIDLLQSLPR